MTVAVPMIANRQFSEDSERHPPSYDRGGSGKQPDSNSTESESEKSASRTTTGGFLQHTLNTIVVRHKRSLSSGSGPGAIGVVKTIAEVFISMHLHRLFP